MNKLKFGYFCSLDTVYQQIAQDYLVASLKKFNTLPLEIITTNYGNWNRNVAEKPKAVLELLSKIGRDECLLLLDADATIEKWPVLLEEIPQEYDIAFHMLSWRSWYGYESDQYELLTGTMFFRNNDRVKKLCEEWYQIASTTCEWEQKVLQKILSNHPVSVWELPVEYCFMKSRPGGLDPLIKLDPVILHYQLSRYYKKNVKGLA